jgi:hypothetical protein
MPNSMPRRKPDAFYGSDEWRNGREAIRRTENYATIVIPANEHTVAGLRPRPPHHRL